MRASRRPIGAEARGPDLRMHAESDSIRSTNELLYTIYMGMQAQRVELGQAQERWDRFMRDMRKKFGIPLPRYKDEP
jgi:hypothetical protein